MSGRVSRSLDEILEQSRVVDSLIGEIATACAEQSQGLDQLNIAMGQMDEVVQGSAAQAEETASAAEELSAQSAELSAVTEALREIVGLRNRADLRIANVEPVVETRIKLPVARREERTTQPVRNRDKSARLQPLGATDHFE